MLVQEYALRPGNRVLLRAANTPMLAACWLAVLKAGGIAVTTMPLYRSAELRFMIEKAQVKLALCDRRLGEELAGACAGIADFETVYFGDDETGGLDASMALMPAEFPNVETAAEDVAIVAFTSGTTGKPKAAMHYHRDLIATCDSYGALVLQPQPDDLFCGSAPLGFTFGLGGHLLFPLYAGAATLCSSMLDRTISCEPCKSAGSPRCLPHPLLIGRCQRKPKTTICQRCGRAFRLVKRSPSRFGKRGTRKQGENSGRHWQHGDAAHLRRLAPSGCATRIDGASGARLRCASA